MEWKEVVPAALVALILAFAVAKLVSRLVPLAKSDLARVSLRSPDVQPWLSGAQEADRSAESSRVSDLGFTNDSPDLGQSLASETHITGGYCVGDEVSAHEDYSSLGTAIDALAKYVFSEDFREMTSSKETTLPDVPQDITERSEMSSRDATLPDVSQDITERAETSLANVERGGGEDDVKIGAEGSMVEDDVFQQSVVDDIHDWEGVESTELEETFGSAANHVAKLAEEQRLKVSNDVQLQLYALYKLATEGPCNTPQPSALKIASRAKWNAWQKLGVVEPEEAMLEYIKKVTDIDPTWNEKSQKNGEARGLESFGDTSKERGRVGPVLSTLATSDVHEGGESALDAIHAYARDGDELGILKILENQTPIDLEDDEGRTALHWAADRGCLNIVKILVSKGAEVRAKDQEGQTPLHYASACEQEAVAQYLVQHGADPLACDNEGVTPSGCCPSSWIWMTSKT